MRLFVALDLDHAAREAIAREQTRLRTAFVDVTPPKWIKPEQMHLTLVFLGELDAELAASVRTDIEVPVAIDPFDLVFAGVGVFPPQGAPRALWIGARNGAPHLHALQQELAARVRRRGIVLEDRPFSPHLTIGRWKSSRPSDRRRVLAHESDRTVARLRVDHATLYQSRLSSAGSTYTELARANLTGSHL